MRKLNTAIQSIPTNIVAGIGGFREREFYRLEDEGERAVPQVGRVTLQEQIRSNRIRTFVVLLGFIALIAALALASGFAYDPRHRSG